MELSSLNITMAVKMAVYRNNKTDFIRSVRNGTWRDWSHASRGDLYGKSLFAMPFGAVCIWMRARGTKWTQTDQVPVHNETIKLPGIQKD